MKRGQWTCDRSLVRQNSPYWRRSENLLVPRKRNCSACQGSGRCSACYGSGTNLHLHQDNPLCRNCHGSGLCSDCGGTGRRRQLEVTADAPVVLRLLVSMLPIGLIAMVAMGAPLHWGRRGAGLSHRGETLATLIFCLVYLSMIWIGDLKTPTKKGQLPEHGQAPSQSDT